MPLRQDILKQRWPTFNPPILPFLAPRVFSPWPSGRNRAQQSTSAAPAVRVDHQPLRNFPSTPADEGVALVFVGEGGGGGDRVQQCTGGNTNSSADYPTPHHFNLIVDKKRIHKESIKERARALEEKAFSGGLHPRRLRRRQSGLKSFKTKVEGALSNQSEEFHKKYKEIWGAHGAAQAEANMDMLGNISTMEQLDGGTVELTSPALSVPKSTSSPNVRKAARKRLTIRRINNHRVRSIKRGRPKLVRWKPANHESFGLSWHARFAVLNFRNESFMRGRKHPRLLSQAKKYLSVSFRRMLIHHRDSASLRATWEMLPETDRIKFWPELMITVLKDYPDSALKVLIATHSNPHPPEYAVVDCLEFITSHYFGNQNNLKVVDINKIFEAVLLLARKGSEGYLSLSQRSIYLLLSNLDLKCTKKLYLSLKKFDLELHNNTLRQFGSVFAKLGEVDLAFEILTRLRKQGADFSSAPMSSLCATLLDQRHRLNNEDYTDFGLFEFMLESGLKPNIIHYNILIQNSLQRGDHETGWKIHDMLIENGNQADEYTYSILLNDAKIRLDTSSIRRVMDLVVQRKIRNEYIMTDLLHAAYLLHLQELETRKSASRGKFSAAFEIMFPTYCEYFETATLSRLIPMLSEQFSIIPEHSNQTLATNSGESITKLKTQYPTLVVMVTAYLQGVSRPHQVLDLYQHFRQLLQDGDEECSMLLSTEHIYNAFLMSLGKFPETLPMCSQVIEDMLKNATDSQVAAHKSRALHATTLENKLATDQSGEADVAAYSSIITTEPSSSPSLQTIPAAQGWVDWSLPSSRPGPAPTVQTWSILLNIFMLHRQPRAAEKVLDLMALRDVSPNLVTWNTLCSGYARLQDTRMAVDVIERIERAGLVTDNYTLRGLSSLTDRRALIQIMRKKEAKMQMTEEESRNTKATLDSLQNALDAEKELNKLFSSEDIPTFGDIKANPNQVDEQVQEVIDPLEDEDVPLT